MPRTWYTYGPVSVVFVRYPDNEGHWRFIMCSSPGCLGPIATTPWFLLRIIYRLGRPAK